MFTSPFPPAECGRRLAAVTVHSPRGWEFGLLLAGGPRPTLVGEVSPSHVRVALPSGALQSWFEGVINPAPHGGTIVRGTAGPRSSTLVPARVVSVMLVVFLVIVTASGVASTVSGPGPATLVKSGFLAAFYVLVWAVTSWETRSQTELLVGKLSEILESTATIEP